MGLADDLASIAPRPARRCQFAAWLETLDTGVRDLVIASVLDKDPGKPKAARQVAAAISRNGYTVSKSTIENHRKGECGSCSWCWPT